MRQLMALLFSTMLFGVQTPPDTTFYAVAYVDVMPASRAAATTAFKQYRDASRKDEGFVRIEFFEQAGRPGHLCLIETWATSRAFDTHAASKNAAVNATLVPRCLIGILLRRVIDQPTRSYGMPFVAMSTASSPRISSAE